MIFDWLTQETQSLWTFIIVIATFLILVMGTIVGFIKSSKYKRIKRRLAIFVKQGNALRVRCFGQQQLPSEKEAQAWAEEVATFLEKQLGDDYRERFYNNDALPVRYSGGLPSGEPGKIENFVTARITRLNQFLAELTRF